MHSLRCARTFYTYLLICTGSSLIPWFPGFVGQCRYFVALQVGGGRCLGRAMAAGPSILALLGSGDQLSSMDCSLKSGPLHRSLDRFNPRKYKNSRSPRQYHRHDMSVNSDDPVAEPDALHVIYYWPERLEVESATYVVGHHQLRSRNAYRSFSYRLGTL